MDRAQIIEALRSAGRGGDPDPDRIVVGWTLFSKGSTAKDGVWREESLAAQATYRRETGAKCLPKGRKLLAPCFVGARVACGKRSDGTTEGIYWLFFDADNVGDWGMMLDGLRAAGLAHIAARSCSHGTPVIDKATGAATAERNVKWHLFLPLAERLAVPAEVATWKDGTYRPQYAHICRALQVVGELSAYDPSVDDLANNAFIGMRTTREADAREVLVSGGALLDWAAILSATGYVAPPPPAPPRQVLRLAAPGAAAGEPDLTSAPEVDAGAWDGGRTRGQTTGSLLVTAFRHWASLGPVHKDGYLVLCPWRSAHSPGCPQRDRDEYDTSTMIFVGGSASGGWVCKHAHCADRSVADVISYARHSGAPLANRPEFGGEGGDEGDEMTIEEARRMFGGAAATKKEAPEAATSEAQGENDMDKVAQSPGVVNLDAQRAAKASKAAKAKEEKAAKKPARAEDMRSEDYPHLSVEGAVALQRSKKGGLRTTAANVTTILRCDDRWSGVLAFNEFSEKVEKRLPLPSHQLDAPRGVGTWEDSDTHGLCNWLARQYGLDLPDGKIKAGMMQAALSVTYHPVREYLGGLRWDGTPRLATWLSRYMGAAQTPYVELVGTLWLISAVARAMQPGCQVDYTLILEGKQGAGKSSALRIIGGAYYRSTRINIDRAPDCYQALRGSWIYEFAEIASFRKADAEDLKDYLTQHFDHYRDSYGHGTRDYQRQCIFGGSVNPDEAKGCTYLTDPTGARRFWPVRCFVTRDSADLAGLQQDRDQLWAEAAHRYAAGERWHPTAEERARLCEPEQAARSVDRDSDPWDQPIAQWLGSVAAGAGVADLLRGAVAIGEDPMGRTIGTVPLTAVTILRHVLAVPLERCDQRAKVRVGKCMQRRGWIVSPTTRSIGGVKCFPYTPNLDDDGREALRQLRELADRAPTKGLTNRGEILRHIFGGELTTARLVTGVQEVTAKLDAIEAAREPTQEELPGVE